MTEQPNPSGIPPRKSGGPALYSRQMAMAMELPFALVAPVLVAGAIGYFLDRWWGSAPLMLLVMGGFGFFAGVRELLRRMKSLSKPVSKPPAPRHTDADG